MIRQAIVAFALLGASVMALPAAAADCELLPEASLRALLPDLGGLEQTVQQTDQVPGRCRFLWPKADRAARELENQQRRRDAMRRGPSLQPLPIWNELSVELLAMAGSEAEARQLFANYLSQQLPERWGSPDPLAGSQLEKLPATGRQQAWNADSRQLLVQIGKRLLLLGVSIEDDPIKNKALAQQLGNGVK
ncbi:MAG: hypothetical protein ACAI44_19185 [Candidatus Sericytochromatia bacterium]